MKNYSTRKAFTIAGFFMLFGTALSWLFESGNKKEFKRLKDFIASE